MSFARELSEKQQLEQINALRSAREVDERDNNLDSLIKRTQAAYELIISLRHSKHMQCEFAALSLVAYVLEDAEKTLSALSDMRRIMTHLLNLNVLRASESELAALSERVEKVSEIYD